MAVLIVRPLVLAVLAVAVLVQTGEPQLLVRLILAVAVEAEELVVLVDLEL